MVHKKILVTFAGAVGSSKTPIAFYLSYRFNFPIFNTDAIRSEVIEDLLIFDKEEFELRRDKRLKELIDKGRSFILDTSIDRKWTNLRESILKEGYQIFIISIDISRDLLINLYKVKGYEESLERVDDLYNDHEEFLRNFSKDVSLHITDRDFKERLPLSEVKLKEFLGS
jgi:hypothetical protein